MADGLDINEIVRRTIQANAKLYKGWVDLSLEYFRGIVDIFGGQQSTAPADDTESGTGAIVLEGVEGASAAGAFMVTNDLGRTLTCELIASEFTDADGNTLRLNATFDPARLQLEPGEQRVVRTSVSIDRKLAAGVAYTGTVSIKGLDGFDVPVVVRRQHRIDTSPIDRVADETATGTGPQKKTTTSSRKTARKRASPKKRTRKKR